MNILELAKEIQEELKFFEGHPAKSLDLEEKKYYLDGLALIMNVDDEVHEKEKEYLLTLINTLGLPQNKLMEFIDFAQNPDKEVIKELLRVVAESGLSDVFLIDCLMVSHADGKIKNSEKSLFDIYCDILNVDHVKKKTLIKKVNIENKKEIMKDNNIEHYYLGIYDNIFSNERLVINSKTIYDKSTIFINCEFEFEEDGNVLFNSKNVKFISCKMISPILNFSNIKKLEITNCKIRGTENRNTKLFGHNIDSVLLKNTVFRDIDNTDELISFYKSDSCEVKIKNCEFNNCSSKYYDLFSFNKVNNVKVINNQFKSCKSSFNLYNHLFNFDIVDKLELIDNVFDSCSSFSKRYSHLFYFETVSDLSIKGNNWNNCSSCISEGETKSNDFLSEVKSEGNLENNKENNNNEYGSFLFYFNKTNILNFNQNSLTNCSTPSNLISFRNIKSGKIGELLLENCNSKVSMLQIVNSDELELEENLKP